MRVSENGIKLIKEFEGCYLKAYQDAVGVWTIGYGITNADKRITGVTIKKGLTISKFTANDWLIKVLNEKYAFKVAKYNSIYKWNQNQFDALVSFAYNIGSIDQLTNNGKRTINEIAHKMLQYNKAGGRVLKGLTRRREAEHKLFCTPVKKKKYKGKLPTLPPRGYFKMGDGIDDLLSYRDQIKLVQKVINWATNSGLDPDGKYGEKTKDAVTNFQIENGITPNGCYGSKCQSIARVLLK